MGFFDFLTEEIAIDLGTANTLIIHNDKVVVDAPSIVARDRVSGKIIAVGPGYRNQDGSCRALEVKTGDTVLFGKYSGTEVKVEGNDYLIMREEDILGVLQ